ALDRAGFAIIASGLEQCIVRKDTTMDKKELEKLFLSLA
ncbi:cytoplasmic protein, partial [Pseudarthrobacter sp. MDT3-9]|nr:cytoplasmic protein [Pseudarthrobacter sp. MDT3-9]